MGIVPDFAELLSRCEPYSQTRSAPETPHQVSRGPRGAGAPSVITDKLHGS
jgi:hypothetical protein